MEVSLQDVLNAREARVNLQHRLLREYQKPLLALTMNMAGPVKRTRCSDFAFWAAAEKVHGGLDILWEELTDAPTGLEALWVCASSAEEVKQWAMEWETEQPVGRLYDLDVIDIDGRKLSRPVARTCLVCGGPAGPCARSRAHGLFAIQAATKTLLQDFACTHLADLAIQSLMEEVELTPKPGLVDRRNNGAHKDMNLSLFRRSAESLRPYFQQAVALGLEREDCMPALQAAGRDAETVMLTATEGVNTHKGAIYAFGLLLAAMGNRLVRGGDIFFVAAALAGAGLPPEKTTHGGQALACYGAKGARGEALAGFPSARRAWAAMRRGPYAALLTLLAEVEDTNLLHRGGKSGLSFVQREAAAILAGPEEEFVSRLEALDDACIRQNLSPGGCADLLALAFFLKHTEKLI